MSVCRQQKPNGPAVPTGGSRGGLAEPRQLAAIRGAVAGGKPRLTGLVSFAGAGVGDVNVEVEDPQGRSLAEVVVEDKGNQVYRCTYKPVQAGPHIVKVTFAGEAIPKTPCTVLIGEGTLFKTAPARRWPLVSLDAVIEQARALCTSLHLGPDSVGRLVFAG